MPSQRLPVRREAVRKSRERRVESGEPACEAVAPGGAAGRVSGSCVSGGNSSCGRCVDGDPLAKRHLERLVIFQPVALTADIAMQGDVGPF
jgi:hypothetical protein